MAHLLFPSASGKTYKVRPMRVPAAELMERSMKPGEVIEVAETGDIIICDAAGLRRTVYGLRDPQPVVDDYQPGFWRRLAHAWLGRPF